MTILWAILGRIWPYLLAAFVALGVYAWDDHRCNSACKSQESRADKLQAAADVAKQRATDLALLWANTLQKADDDTRAKLAAQAQTFTDLMAEAKSLSPLPSIVLSAPTVVVLNGVTAAANDTPAPEVDHGAGQAISESDLAQRWAEAGEAYSDAVTKLHACISTYEDFRNEQIH